MLLWLLAIVKRYGAFVTVMAVSVPGSSLYTDAQQQETSTHLMRRIEKKCTGFDCNQKQYFELYQQIEERLSKIDDVCEQAEQKQEVVTQVQTRLLSLYHAVAVEIRALKDICDDAYELIPNNQEVPDRKDYMMDFFEATEVFAGKSGLGFQDYPRRTARTISYWSQLSQYHDCILMLFNKTPDATVKDQYELARYPVVTLTSYKEAGIWCIQTLQSVIRLNESVQEPLAALEFLYEVENRRTLDGYISKRTMFPFHKVTKIIILSGQCKEEIVPQLRNEEREEKALAYEKEREPHTKTIESLEQKVEQMTEQKQAMDWEYQLQLDIKNEVHHEELAIHQEMYEQRIWQLEKENRHLIESLQEKEQIINDRQDALQNLNCKLQRHVDVLQMYQESHQEQFVMDQRFMDLLHEQNIVLNEKHILHIDVLQRYQESHQEQFVMDQRLTNLLHEQRKLIQQKHVLIVEHHQSLKSLTAKSLKQFTEMQQYLFGHAFGDDDRNQEYEEEDSTFIQSRPSIISETGNDSETVSLQAERDQNEVQSNNNDKQRRSTAKR